MKNLKRFEQIFMGVIIAAVLAFLIRCFFDSQLAGGLFEVMGIGFLLGVPFLIGYITVYIAEKNYIYKMPFAIFTPWISIMALFLLTLAFSVEGWACWIMALPIFLIASSFGGLWAHNVRKRQNKNKLQLSIVLLLPFIVAPIEHYIGASTKVSQAYTEITIHATKRQIWQNVTRVRTIDQKQDSASFTRSLGFPRPIKAELDKEAVGGRRKAIFDKGLVFDEEVIAYQPEKSMTFTIHANPYDIPSTTMDKHIVIGGDYFDVLTGTYQLEQIGPNTCKLHLYSSFKLHTTFNFYADIWAGLIMKDIQQNILKVIKERAESQK